MTTTLDPNTPCLHCTHYGQDVDECGGGSPYWRPHCDHEGHGRQNDPAICVHCALIWANVPSPHRKIVRHENEATP